MYNYLGYNSPKIIQSQYIKKQLYTHQKTSLWAMAKLENEGKIIHQKMYIETNIGILGDPSGTGKSLTMVAHLTSYPQIYPKDRIHQGSPFICMKDMNQENNIKCNLFIVPIQLLEHWKKTFKNSLYLNVFILDKINKLNLLDYKNIENYDVILVPSIRYLNLIKKFPNFKWNRIIIDEASEIKLPINFSWNCNFVWLLTSRLDELFYSKKGYLNPIFDNLSYFTFNFLIIKSENNFLKDSIKLPGSINKNIYCQKEKNNNFKEEYKNLLNLLNDGKNLLHKLNCNIGTKKQIIKKIKKIGNENDIERINNIDNNKCLICLDTCKIPIITPSCKNIFCLECFIKSMNTKCQCPICRKEIPPNDIYVISNEICKKKIVKKKNNKISNLIKLLKNKKAILYYPHENLSLFQILDNMKIKYDIITGTESSVIKVMKKYNNNNLDLIIIKNFNNLYGLNIQNFNYVIFFENPTNKQEKILLSCVDRIGRNKKLTNIKLFHKF